ncbi:MAG: Holliday junction resolvase RuvX [Myxococcales bacterium]
MGRVLAIDLGDRRAGLALSDPLGVTAQGLPTLERRGDAADVETLRALCAEREVERVVVGLPRNMDGSEGPRAQKSRAFARRLHDALGLPVFLWDERLSSAEAERVLIAADVSRSKRKQVVDRMAAQLILQGYLEAGRPEVDPA